MPDLLLELFSEEIPARMQTRASVDLKKRVTDGLVEAGLTYAHAAAFSTPRRLTLAIEGLTAQSATLREERKGPRTDAPEKAIEGFLRATGLARDDLEVREDKKGAVYFATIVKPGRSAAEILAELVPDVIRSFPWPKSMRWGAGSLRWVRPLQSILCILTDEAGAQVVPFDVDGIAAGDTTEGHRFMAPGRFTVTGFESYELGLARAHVILDPATRAEKIWHDAEQLAFAQGLELVEDRGLLAEVAGLVEWPVVLMGDIGDDFLDLPPEVLQTSMREHQKFFSVRNPKTGRIEKYVTVANRETADHGATILKGNGKVLAARLSDAKFFWENDLRKVRAVGMTGLAEPLANVTFHNKLGSQAERIARIAALAREIAPLVGAKPDLAEEAARVAKADLASEMVYEFPELQGVMGTYYARAAGHDDGVPEACAQHYQPLGPSDAVPTHPVSVAVALADKIDTLTGFWAIDEKPTGSGDPYALRRAALGVIRILLENGFRTSLNPIFTSGLKRHRKIAKPREELEKEHAELARLSGADGHVVIPPMSSVAERQDLLSFFFDRLKVHLRAEGLRHDVIDACLSLGQQDDLVLLVARVRALQAFLETEDGANLLAGYKRANNILTAEEKKDGIEYSLDPDVKFAETAEEKALFAALDRAEAAIVPALGAEDFAVAMAAMAALRAPIDAFFEGVMVNADNQIVRRNRLCLLNRIRAVMNRVALFSALEG
ncbi:glycine--tRNA ligase subunit beta [Halovulum dunhuangense]|uniref:Glycine--tRNA ligase beta subunit n=1 Tax=Halovulum dunhuangense TaxID=1505036 RepID=A0A849L1W4_9RHOB|nr:glycine--tRNA ligase subunit beta [Halovulum dunhuangense]NNU80239.1 glycine--tRNA ligase subunit beta [Halovulum dunhuangense]